MRPIYTYLLAGAVTLTGIGVRAYAETPAKDLNQQQAAANKLEQIGNQMADPTTAQDVRGLLANVVNDAVTPGKFDGLVGFLAKPQRDRMGDLKTAKTDALNRTITQFRADFKAKYNQDFALSAGQLKDVIVYAGRDKNSATVFVPASLLDGTPGGMKTLPEAQQTIGNTIKKPLANADAAATGVTPAAEAKIPPSATKSAVEAAARDNPGMGLTLNVINEARGLSAWRISIPNEITAEQLQGNLNKHLQMLDDQKAVWPGDASAAYHAAAYQVLEALNDSSLVTAR